MISIDCTQNYLGNSIVKPELNHRLEHLRSLQRLVQVQLTQADQKKSRIYTRTNTGDSIGILKQRDWQFTHGDVFQLEGDRLLLVHLESQRLMTLSIKTCSPDSSLKLVHLGHTLGNYHYPIVVTADKIYVQIPEDTSHIEEAIKAFKINGLKIEYERRSPNQALSFETHHH